VDMCCMAEALYACKDRAMQALMYITDCLQLYSTLAFVLNRAHAQLSDETSSVCQPTCSMLIYWSIELLRLYVGAEAISGQVSYEA